jgi:GH35 family endo-1,4-beta-xylanase
LKQYEKNPAALRKAVDNHIVNIMSATKGRIEAWDVLNEPVNNNDIIKILGAAEMGRWFQVAHRVDPQARLFLNDYAGFAARGENTDHKDAFEKIARQIKGQNVPIHGIGIQSHFGWGLTPPDKLLAELDRWSKPGFEIHITEFDINMTSEKLQALYTRDFYTAAFSHPTVTSITMWGFWEGRHWAPDAALYRKDWTPKPAAQAFIDLVHKEWTTRDSGTTNASGEYSTRGFYGDYVVTATHNGQSKTERFPLRPGSAVLKVAM